MPCSKFGYRGFKHGQGHGRGQSCKQRCMLGAMTIPELLNRSNVCQAIPPRYNNCKFRRSRNCETYRRECTSSYSDDEPERLETPNNVCENDYECADTRLLVRECIYPPCQTPPLFERPIACPTRLPCEKPPSYKPSPAISSTCSNTCDDSYIEIPCPYPDPAGQYYSDSLCKKPSLCQRLPISCPDPSVCKEAPSAQIPSMCTTTPPSESQSIVICDPDEDKVGRRVSFGSVSEQRITPCFKRDSCALEPVCIIEMPICAVASTQVCPKPTQSCATQNDISYTSSVESQSDLCDCKKGSTASLEVHSQTYSESSITCGAKGCPKSTTAKSKRSNDSSKGKKQKEKKELNSCDAVDCPKSTSIIHDCPPCASPSPSKKTLKYPKYKKNFKNKEHPPSASKSPQLTPSASNEIRSESLCSNKSEALCTCTYNNEEESDSKCDKHKNSNKKSWFRKCKGKTTRKEQQKPIDNSKQRKENTKTVSTAPAHGEQSNQGHFNPEEQHSQHTKVTLNDQERPRGFVSNGQLVQGESKIRTQDLIRNGTEQCMREHIPQGQNVHSQLLQGAQTPHGQLFPDRQPLQEQIRIPSEQFASGIQTSSEVTSHGVQISPTHFGQQEQMPQSQVVSGIRTQPGPLAQSAQTSLRNSITPGGQLPLSQFALEEQMPPNQFVSKMQTPLSLSSQSSKTPQSQFNSQDQLKKQQYPQSEFISDGQMPQSQFAPGAQTVGGHFTPTGHTPQDEFPGGQYPRGQFTPDGQNLLGQSSPGQVPQRQFASGQKYPKNQLAQIPQNEFVSPRHISQSPLIPGGQNLQGQFAPGRIPEGQFAPEGQYSKKQFNSLGQIVEGGFVPGGHVPQSQFTPDGRYNQGFPQNQYTPNDQTLSSHFIPDRKFGESMPISPIEQIIPDQLAAGGQNTQLSSNGQIAQSHFGGTAPQSQFTTKPFNTGGISVPYSSPDQFSQGKMPLHLQEQGQYQPERPGQFAPRGSIPPIQTVSGGQRLSRQPPPGGQMAPSQLVSQLPQDQIRSEDSNRQKLAPRVGTPPDQFVLGSLDKVDQGERRDQLGMINKPHLSSQIPQTEMSQHLQDQVQSPRETGLLASGGQNTQLSSNGQIAQSHFGGTAPQSQFTTKPFNTGGYSLPYSSPDQFSQGKMPLHLQEQGQYQPERPGQFAPRGSIPPIQTVSGGQRLSRQPPPGGQMAPSQLVSQLPQDQIRSENSNRQKLAPRVGTPPDQFVLGSLDKVDQGERRDQLGMINKPHLSGQIPPTEMSQHLQDQVQSPRETGLLASGSPIPPGQSNTGSQKPPRQAPIGGQMPPSQSTPTTALFTGGQVPSNQYTSTELPQDQVSSEILNKQLLASQVGTPPDQLDLRNLDKTDLGAPRDQNWHGIICPLCGFQGKIITTNVSPCNSLRTVCNCVKIACNCLTMECRDKFKCTCCCNNEDEAPKNCQYACIQCTEAGQMLPTQSVSGSKISSNPYVSAGMLPGQFSPENLSRDKNTCKNKKSSKNCQDACVQCKRTWYVQNLIVNTSLYEFQHPNTVLAVETPKVTDILSAIPKSNACCECHYPPMFHHFQCSGNMCGICTCGDTE